MDAKSKKQLIVIGVMAPILVIMIFSNLSKGRVAAPQVTAPDAVSPDAVAAPAVEAQTPPDVLEARRLLVATIQSREWGRNPFIAQPVPVVPKAPVPRAVAAPPKRVAPPPPTFHLAGIVYDVNSSYAVINGELRMVGDRVQSYVITKITPSTVTLEKNGQSMDLKMFPEIR